MSRTLRVLVGLLFLGASALAGPGHVYDVKNYGAKGDGKTKDTQALQAAIDACAKTGGTVRLHDGVFLSGTITLKSNMHFTIEGTATLKGTQDDADYPDTNPKSDNTQLHNCRKTLVYAERATNLVIDGSGTIDGNGGKPEWQGSSKQRPERTRPMAVFIVQSDQVTIQDIKMKNAAMWGIVNMETDHLTIEHIDIHSPYGGTRDGIDIVDCHHVLVENCTIYSEDDSICLKSGTARGCLDVTVRKDHVLQSTVANGLKMGTASTGGFKNVTFEDVVVEHCDKAAMAVESVDGAAIQNITFKNITIHDAGTPLFVLLGHRSGPSVGSIDSVTFDTVTADQTRHSWGSIVSGTSWQGTTYEVRNVVFRGCNLGFKGKLTEVPSDPPEYAGQYPDPNLWGAVPAAGIFFRHVHGVTLHDTTIDVKGKDVRSATVERDVTGLTK